MCSSKNVAFNSSKNLTFNDFKEHYTKSHQHSPSAPSTQLAVQSLIDYIFAFDPV